MRLVASSWRVIDGVLKEHVNSTYKALRPSVNARKIEQLETLFGQKLPRDLANSLAVHDGMRPSTDFVGYMTLLSAAQIRSWWQVQCRVQKLGEFGGDENTRTRKIKNDLRWRPGWIPVMADAGGDLIVLDLDPGSAGTRGQLFRWYNYGAFAMRVIAGSFREWLDAVAEELIHRRFSLDEFGGIQLRKQLA